MVGLSRYANSVGFQEEIRGGTFVPMCVPCCPLLSLLSEISQLMIYIANLISSWCEDLRYFGDHRDPSLDDFVARDGPAFVPQPFDIYPVWLSGPAQPNGINIKRL